MATTIALARAKHKLPNADSLSTPLLGDDGDQSSGKEGCFSVRCCMSYLAGLVLSAAWGLEFIMYGGVVLLFGATLGITFSMFFAYAFEKNASIGSVNDSNNEMRGEINKVNDRIDEQAGLTDSLEGEAAKLAELNQQLAMIAQTQGANVEVLMSLVKRNKDALKEMTRLTKAELAQKLVDLVIDGDKDGDFIIDADEAHLLYLRLNNLRSYIKVNEANFKKAINDANGELKGVMNIVKQITGDTSCISEDERIFIIDKYMGQGRSSNKKKQ